MSELQRIKKVVNWLIYKEFAENESALATSLGYTKSSFSQIMNGKVHLSEKFIKKLCELDENINFVWVKDGVGEMMNPESVSLTNQESLLNIDSLPIIPFDAVAGWNGLDNPGVSLDNMERYVVPEFTSKGAEFIIRVSGSSMYPKYSNGDLLACRKVHEILFFQWGKIYVIDSSQGAMIKRIYEDANPDMIICHSDNAEHYPRFSIPKSDIRSLSIVLGVIRME
jgi:repressor LexA